ncbi:MAG TPA: cation:proton antiporter [Myxococcota bacterium]|nr:cation:proton antiporter [Myxococcota bacterium]
MRVVLLGLLFFLMVAVQAIGSGSAAGVASRAALAFGFLLLLGFLVGEILSRWSIPRISGYLLVGMIAGPSGLAVVDAAVIEHMRLIDDLALALIAFTAGAELRISRLRARARSILSITLTQTIVVFLTSVAALWFLQAWLGLFPGLGQMQFLAVISILGLIATANSPSTAVAVIVEARAKGEITDTVLGCTVLKDIVVLVGFSLVFTLSLPLFSFAAGNVVTHSVFRALLDVSLSLVVGALFGLLMIVYLRVVRREKILFVLAAAFLTVSLSRTFHLDHLLLAVCAGFVVGNFSRHGRSLLEGLEGAGAPVFLIFFCLAGAGLDLSVFRTLWPVALVYVLVRGVSTWAATGLGALVAGDRGPQRRLVWTGFIGQAGVSLGLAAIARKAIPGVGATISDLVIGGIVINQLVGPLLFRWALLRSGEGERQKELSVITDGFD